MHLNHVLVAIAGRSTRVPLLMVLAAVLVSAGCRAGATGRSLEAGPGTILPTATAADRPPWSPTAAASASAAHPSPAASLSADPPVAAIAAEGGDPVVGQLGSYAWSGSGSDSPWLPGAPIAVGANEPLTVTVAGGVPIAAWTARRVPAGTANGVGAVALGAGSDSIVVAAREPGSWSILVDVQFADDLGSAAYYWRLDVR